MREEMTNSAGQTIKKGKRSGFDIFNQLSCKTCKRSFHKHQGLAMHINQNHKGSLNISIDRPAIKSWHNKAALTTPKALTKIIVHKKSNSDSLTKCKPNDGEKAYRKLISSRPGLKITPLDGFGLAQQCPQTILDENVDIISDRKFSKLTLSAKRSIVDDYNKSKTSEAKKLSPGMKKKSIQLYKRNSIKSLMTVFITDTEIPKIQDIFEKETTAERKKSKVLPNSSVNLVEKEQKESEEEFLLAENEVNALTDTVEVKTATGKLMFVERSILKKIIDEKFTLETSSKQISNADEMLLLEENDFDNKEESLKRKFTLEDYIPSKRVRCRGF